MRRAHVTQAHTLAAGQQLTHSTRLQKSRMHTRNYCLTLLSFAAHIQLLSEKKIRLDTFWTDLVNAGLVRPVIFHCVPLIVLHLHNNR
jgi:hypothetical protein